MKTKLLIIGSLLATTLCGPAFAGTSSAPAIGTGYTGASKGEITLSWKACLPGATNLTLTGIRASGDKDTYCDNLVDDSLKSAWPRWHANGGEFVNDDDTGTTVHWNAPNEERSVTFILYEDDQATAAHTSDDWSVYGYGLNQDSNIIQVGIMCVDLFVRTSGNTTDGVAGPNSRGKLGLWNNDLPAEYNMKLFCENQTTGDTVNGGASYTGSHSFAVGTCLKTEIYGHITDRGGIADADVEEKTNWRVYQQYRGWLAYNGSTDPPGRSEPEWVADGDPRVDSHEDTTFKHLNTNYLYFSDAPGMKNVSGGSDGDTLEASWIFMTWSSFLYEGEWHRVSQPEEWGYTAKLKKVSVAWTVEQEAEAN